MKQPPRDFDTLRAQVMARHAGLSPRLQQIARFMLEHPNDVALQTIAMLSRRIGVAPSAIIRFAKAMDYRGFSDLQAVLRLPLSDSVAETRGPSGKGLPAVAVLEELSAAGVVSLKRLVREVPPEHLEQAVELLATRRAVYVVGQRRAFAAAVYLACALGHRQRPVHLLDGVGGMVCEQVGGISDADLLIAVSFPPYALETAELAACAAARGAAVVAIVDSPLNPVAASATVALEIHEREVHGLALLTATLCLIQTLVVAAGRRCEDQPCGREPLLSGAG